MMTVYARNINAIPPSTTPPSGEVAICHVPYQNGEEPVFLTANANGELGNAGSFEFSIDPTNKYADIWKQMITLVRVAYDDETIFYGRVLTIDRDMFRTRKVHCEGAFTFFMDSVFEMKSNGSKITIGTFLEQLIEAHNTCMADCSEKQIFLGEVPGHYSSNVEEVQKVKNDSQKFNVGTGYKTVKELLEELAGDYSGHMRVRYNASDGKLYLDWLKTYLNKNISNQTMSVSSNVVDLSDTMEVNNIFTHVVCVGKATSYSDGTGGGGSAKHAVTVNVTPSGYGTASAAPQDPKPGDTVILKYLPRVEKPINFSAQGSDRDAVFYQFVRWDVVSGGVTISNNSFVMGNQNVVINAVFKSSTGKEGNAKSISVSANYNTYGTVSCSARNAMPGETVTLSANPLKGYKFDKWQKNSGDITIVGNSFVMGSTNVSITGVFVYDLTKRPPVPIPTIT